MAGTDTTAPFIFPGSSLHEELSLLVQAGLTPIQALQAATRLPAEFLGKSQTQGTVEQGKFADLGPSQLQPARRHPQHAKDWRCNRERETAEQEIR